MTTVFIYSSVALNTIQAEPADICWLGVIKIPKKRVSRPHPDLFTKQFLYKSIGNIPNSNNYYFKLEYKLSGT